MMMESVGGRGDGRESGRGKAAGREKMARMRRGGVVGSGGRWCGARVGGGQHRGVAGDRGRYNVVLMYMGVHMCIGEHMYMGKPKNRGPDGMSTRLSAGRQ